MKTNKSKSLIKSGIIYSKSELLTVLGLNHLDRNLIKWLIKNLNLCSTHE